MKNLIASSLALALGIGVALPASAHEWSSDQRRHNQAQRIEEGIENSTLTRWEAKQLWREQREINRHADEFYADGRLSRREARILDAHYDKASRNIYAFKHNDRDARYGHHSSWRGERNDPWSEYQYSGHGGREYR